MGKWLGLVRLERLTIKDCSNVGVFVHSLTDEASVLEKSALDRIYIEQTHEDDDWMEALGEFLGSFSGLTTLFISCPKEE